MSVDVVNAMQGEKPREKQMIGEWMKEYLVPYKKVDCPWLPHTA